MSGMTVVHLERQPISGVYSVERLFRAIRAALPAYIKVRVLQCPTPAHSRFWLLRGLWRAKRVGADVNHIVGDVHYVALALPGSHTIVTVHDLNHLEETTGLRKMLLRWLYFTLPLRHCHAVT